MRKGSDALPGLPAIVFSQIFLLFMEAIAVAMTGDRQASVAARILSPMCFLVGLWVALTLRRSKLKRDAGRAASARSTSSAWTRALLGGGVGVVLGQSFISDSVSISVMLPPMQFLLGLCITVFALLLRERLSERRAPLIPHGDAGELADLLHASRELAQQLVATGNPAATYRRALELVSLAAGSVGSAADADQVASPLYLIWGSLTDRFDAAPPAVEQAVVTMKRAAREWLSLGENDEDDRLAYLDRWVYDECRYERPKSTR